MVNLKRVLWHLLGGTRGGPLRIRILLALRERPCNTNQLAVLLGIDYKTAQHHLRVLVENRILSSTGDAYGAMYHFTKDMEDSMTEFERITATVRQPAPSPRQPSSPPSTGAPPEPVSASTSTTTTTTTATATSTRTSNPREPPGGSHE